MQSMPHSTATRIASSPWQWAATFRPARWASSTIASSSSVEYWRAPAGPVWDMTPPDALTLISAGAVLDLVPHGLADLGHAVGDALLDGEREHVRSEGLEHGGVEVAPGRADGVPGRDDPGPVDPAHVDGLHEGHVEQDPTGLDEQPEVAHGREPGPQGTTSVGHGPQGAKRRILLHRDQRAGVVGSAHEQVDLHVHQAGEQRHVAEVDLDGVRRHRPGADADDAVVLDEQVTGLDQPALSDIQHPGADEVDGRLRARVVGACRLLQDDRGVANRAEWHSTFDENGIISSATLLPVSAGSSLRRAAVVLDD